MKSTTRIYAIFSVLVLAVLLSGCFGWFEKEQKPAADEAQKAAAEVGQPGAKPVDVGQPVSKGDRDMDAPPSFNDGDLYLKAIGAKDLNLCAKIGNAELKARCETKVKEKQ